MQQLVEYASVLPGFFLYFLASLALMAVFSVIYLYVTPHREIALIREGNCAAAISLAGTVMGFALPLASLIAHSSSLRTVSLWGCIILLIQLAAYFVTRAVIPTLSDDITTGKTSVAVFAALISLSIGLINAACLVY